MLQLEHMDEVEKRGKQKAESKSKSRHVPCLLLPIWFIP